MRMSGFWLMVYCVGLWSLSEVVKLHSVWRPELAGFGTSPYSNS